jgi:predicted nucleic acid-binding protein
MTSYYFDANALVKYQLVEPGTTWVRQIVDAVDDQGLWVYSLFTAEITIVEVAAALAIVHRTGHISRTLRDRLFSEAVAQLNTRCRLVSVTPSLLMAAAHLTLKHPLKGYDAIQLTAALELQRSAAAYGRAVIFSSGDQRLLKAAGAEGLKTANPYDYVDLDLAGMTSKELTRAAYMLGERGDPAAVPALIPQLQHPKANVRRLVASALGKLGDPSAVPALLVCLLDTHPQVRQYAAKALGRIGDSSALSALQSVAHSDSKDYVRKAAAAAVDRLANTPP